MWFPCSLLLLQEDDRFVGWGLSGREVSREGPSPDSPSPRGRVCRFKAESQPLQRLEGAQCALGFPRLLAGRLGRWELGQGSGFKGHRAKPLGCYLGDRWGCAGGGGRVEHPRASEVVSCSGMG